MNIYHDLQSIIEVAKHYAKEHNTNYNIILHNPVNGAFGNGSTYEYVADSYFEKERPNVILLHKTDDLLTNEKVAMTKLEEDIEIPSKYMVLEGEEIERFKRMVEASGGLIHRGDPYVREQPKISRNEQCPCGSGKKYKKCCQ